MSPAMRSLACCVSLAAVMTMAVPAEGAGETPDDGALRQGFAAPPDSAKPWVYWFWLNGNITKEGVTADLEAMKRAGVGGVLIMEVDQGVPAGPLAFMSDRWREMFQYVVSEAERLGLEVNMNNDAGWTGSGGPWIEPEDAMQQLVWTETRVGGPGRVEVELPQPGAVAGFYRDIKALAIPDADVIARGSAIDVTHRVDGRGRFVWDAPEGAWVVLRIGHTPTGKTNHPAPASGTGLECDKLNPRGIEANFDGMMAQLIEDVGDAAGETLVSTHIDSWEVGEQNWTEGFAEKFADLRGYELEPFLPVMCGRVVDSFEVTARFRQDLQQTLSDLLVRNYAGRLRELANAHGMRLSIEAYGGPCDDLPYAGRADEPMCEFWIGGGAVPTIKEMASAVHTYGKPILGAEAFTAGARDRWLEHPASIKALGDQAFCQGVNRFVFHRYAMQPWLDRQPGMTMGPWGVHYERTQTWWEWTKPWHDYLARCQFMLRQGVFVADVCYLRPEAAPQGPRVHSRDKFDWDEIDAEALIKRMSVRNGELVLPDGVSYQVLALPGVPAMSPELLRKIQELGEAGATIVGNPPERALGLTGYPRSDAEVARLVEAMWGEDGCVMSPASTETMRGDTGANWEQLLTAKWIWANEGDPVRGVQPGKRYFRRAFELPPDADVEQAALTMTADNAFEVWLNGELVGAGDAWGRTFAFDVTPLVTGGRNVIAVEAANTTDVVSPAGLIGALEVRLAGGGVLLVKTDANWRAASAPGQGWRGDSVSGGDWEAARELGLLGIAPWHQATVSMQPVYPSEADLVELLEGSGGPDFLTEAPFDYIHRRADATDIYFVANPTEEHAAAECAFRVGRKVAELWDPLTGTVQESPSYGQGDDGYAVIELSLEPSGSVFVVFTEAMNREPLSRSRETRTAAHPLEGPWTVSFDPQWGGPERVVFEELQSWHVRPEEGIRFYSGEAVYGKRFDLPEAALTAGDSLTLDLGDVQVMARVKVNGKDLGVLWRPPYVIDITEAARAGINDLEVTVVNLWVNRMIGDQHLPEDSERNPNGTLAEWPHWVLEGKPSPAGRYTFTTWRLWSKDDPLQPSGLLGPVALRSAAQKE